MLGEIFSVVAPIFVLTALGYGWNKRNLPFDNETISNLVMYLATPALVFSSLTRLEISAAELIRLGGATAAVLAGCMLLGYLILRALGWNQNAFLPSLMQANTGNMGLPLVLLTFGETGLALGMVVFFLHAISQYSLGVTISSGRLQLGWLARQPIIWSVVASLLVLYLNIPVPKWLRNTTELLGGLLIPGMLLMLGASLSRLGIRNPGKMLFLSMVRLGLGAGLSLLVIWLFELDGLAAGVLFLQASMPVAVFNFVFAERFDREPDQVAALVVVSTLVSFLLLPAIVAYSLTFSSG